MANRACGPDARQIVVFDDVAAIRLSLGLLQTSIPEVDGVDDAADLLGACGLVDSARPDVVVLDVNQRHGAMGIGSRRHLTRRLPQPQVLVLPNLVSPHLRQNDLEAGASALCDTTSAFMQARHWIAHWARTLDR